MLLDVYCHISSLPLGKALLLSSSMCLHLHAGYNNPELLELADQPWMRKFIVQRQAIGVMPPTDWPELLETTFSRIYPHPDLNCVFTSHTGSDANEFAFKTACMFKVSTMILIDFELLLFWF